MLFNFFQSSFENISSTFSPVCSEIGWPFKRLVLLLIALLLILRKNIITFRLTHNFFGTATIIMVYATIFFSQCKFYFACIIIHNDIMVSWTSLYTG